jgi:hypothetical protein
VTAVTISLIALLAPFGAGVGGGGGGTEARAVYRHAYYLFAVAPVADGADRGIPMLLSQKPIDEATASGEGACVVIWTYERDSVFSVREGLRLHPDDLKPKERHVQIPTMGDGAPLRWFRYQRVALSEARHLLVHPEGSIPVHRPAVARETLEALRASLLETE